MTSIRLASAGEDREVRLESGKASLDGTVRIFREIWRGGSLVALELDGTAIPVRVARQGDRAFVWCAGEVYELRRLAGRTARVRHAGGETHAGLVAPMPGRIRKSLVRTGQEVAKGQVVVVLEAMKMEHAIRAPQDGVVTRIEHREGDLVEAGTVLAEIS